MSRRTSGSIGSALAIVAMTLAACGSGAASTTSGNPTVPPAIPTATAAALVATPKATTAASPAASVVAAGPMMPGERIVFGIRTATTADIWSALSDGTDMRQLTSGAGSHLCPDPSPDSSQIAYCSDTSGAFEIWMMQADGTKQTQLTKLGGTALFPDISPDGKTIAFEGVQGSDGHSEIYLVDAATGTSPVALTSCAGGKEGCSNNYPEFSPDGKQIVFTHQDDYDGTNGINQQIWVMNVDGSHAHAVTTGPDPKDQLATWSPDGKSIAFAAGFPDSEGIWVAGADGKNPRQLSGCAAGAAAPCAAGSDWGPTWSPDGTSIAFAHALSKDDRPVFVMNADGTDQHRLTPGQILVGVPAWR